MIEVGAAAVLRDRGGVGFRLVAGSPGGRRRGVGPCTIRLPSPPPGRGPGPSAGAASCRRRRGVG